MKVPRAIYSEESSRPFGSRLLSLTAFLSALELYIL